MPHSKMETGATGERLAAQMLENKGYIILYKNFRCKIGEVDIVAKIEDLLVFVEVKTRRNCVYGRPSEAVDLKKRKRIASIAQCYMKYNFGELVPCRFDVIEVLCRDEIWWCNHIKNAFGEGGEISAF